MLKKVFYLISALGIVIICILTFTIPNNPYEIIPAITTIGFDKPLWLCIIICCSFIYLIVLWTIYDKISHKKIA